MNYKKPISKQLLLTILVFSSFVTLITSAIQLAWDYYDQVTEIDNNMDRIKLSHTPSLAASLWELNERQSNIELDGIALIPYGLYVDLSTPNG